MPPRFLKNLVISFIVVFALTAGYHNVALGAQYGERLKAVSTIVDGKPQANFPAFLASVLLTALGYAWFVPAVGARNRQYIVHGAMMGLATLGTFTFLAHALVGGWDMWLTTSDFIFGLLTGLIMGGLFTFLEPKA